MRQAPIKHTNKCLRGYDGNALKVVGHVNIPCTYKKRTSMEEFYIKCIKRARELVFWPNMAADIKDIVQRCQICLEYRNANIREPLQPSKIPDAPWEKAANDILYWNGRNYLLLVDYYIGILK